MSVNIHIIHSYTHVHEACAHPSQYHYICATSIKWYNHFWWRFQIQPGTEMPVLNFASKPFLQCHDFHGSVCTFGCHLVYSTVQALSVSGVTSTSINSSHSEHTQRHWWPPQVHPRREHRLHFPPHLHRQEPSALLSPISVKILPFPFPVLLVAAGSSIGETENLRQLTSVNYCYRLCPSPIWTKKSPKSAPLKNWS